MDSHAQIGPDKPNYDADVLTLAGLLASGRTIYVRLAAHGTQHQLILARPDFIQPFGTPDGRDPIDGIGDPLSEWIMLAKMGDVNGAVFLSGYVHWTYAAEKLDVTQRDAEAIADFVNRLLRAGDLIPSG